MWLTFRYGKVGALVDTVVHLAVIRKLGDLDFGNHFGHITATTGGANQWRAACGGGNGQRRQLLLAAGQRLALLDRLAFRQRGHRVDGGQVALGHRAQHQLATVCTLEGAYLRVRRTATAHLRGEVGVRRQPGAVRGPVAGTGCRGQVLHADRRAAVVVVHDA